MPAATFLYLEGPKDHRIVFSMPSRRPGRLDKCPAHPGRAGFRNRGDSSPVGARVLARDEPQVGLHTGGAVESTGVVQCCGISHRRHWPHTGHRHQSHTDRILLGEFFQFLVGTDDLDIDRLDHDQHALDSWRNGAPSVAHVFPQTRRKHLRRGAQHRS